MGWVRSNLADEPIGTAAALRADRSCADELEKYTLARVDINLIKSDFQDIETHLSSRDPRIVSFLLSIPCAACARCVAREIRCALSATRARIMPAAAADHP